MTNLRKKTGVLGLVMGSLLMLGCGGASGYCDALCECEGCSDAEYDDCIDDIEDAQKLADDEGCSAQGDDLLSCVNAEAECRDGDLDADGCSTEQKALQNCFD